MIIVLLGASGSGKSTIEHELATHYGFEKIISYTTREPRKNEENGNNVYAFYKHVLNTYGKL